MQFGYDITRKEIKQRSAEKQELLGRQNHAYKQQLLIACYLKQELLTRTRISHALLKSLT